MDALLAIAAALTFLVGAAHSYLGERYILVRLFRRQDLPHLLGSDVFTKRTLRFAWHVTSLAWWGFGAILAAAAGAALDAQTTLRIVAVTFAATSLAVLAGSRGRHLAWPVFGAIATLAWVAS